MMKFLFSMIAFVLYSSFAFADSTCHLYNSDRDLRVELSDNEIVVYDQGQDYLLTYQMKGTYTNFHNEDRDRNITLLLKDGWGRIEIFEYEGEHFGYETLECR